MIRKTCFNCLVLDPAEMYVCKEVRMEGQMHGPHLFVLAIDDSLNSISVQFLDKK